MGIFCGSLSDARNNEYIFARVTLSLSDLEGMFGKYGIPFTKENVETFLKNNGSKSVIEKCVIEGKKEIESFIEAIGTDKFSKMAVPVNPVQEFIDNRGVGDYFYSLGIDSPYNTTGVIELHTINSEEHVAAGIESCIKYISDDIEVGHYRVV